MQLNIEDDITIMAPAAKVWGVLAHSFADIGEWASAIPQSTAVTHPDPSKAGSLAGRVCTNSVPGFSAVQEEFTDYNEVEMRFSYKVTQGMPAFMLGAENNWSVQHLSNDQCLVTIRGKITLSPFPGLLLAPFMKRQMQRLGAKTAEELKHFVEQGHPHPRKVKSQRKALSATAV